MVCDRRFRLPGPRRRRAVQQGDERGFTLLELIVVMAVISVVALVSAEFLGLGAHLHTITTVRQELLQTGRMAIQRMTREMMSADSVISADASSFRFLDPSSADITFARTGSQVLRNSDPLVDHVESFVLDYRDRNSATLATPVLLPDSIWRVRITLTVSRLEESITLLSEVCLRKGG
jgi:prepilin-type N-terminal cleavage/methylation domain-containing protein